MQGLRLELHMNDQEGLLSDVTHIFRENGLSIAHARVTTWDDQAVNIFYVIDPSSCHVGMKVVEAMCKSIGHATLQVKGFPRQGLELPNSRNYHLVGFSEHLNNWSMASRVWILAFDGDCLNIMLKTWHSFYDISTYNWVDTSDKSRLLEWEVLMSCGCRRLNKLRRLQPMINLLFSHGA